MFHFRYTTKSTCRLPPLMIPRLLIVNDAHEPFGRHRMLPHPIDEGIPFRFTLFFLAPPFRLLALVFWLFLTNTDPPAEGQNKDPDYDPNHQRGNCLAQIRCNIAPKIECKSDENSAREQCANCFAMSSYELAHFPVTESTWAPLEKHI